jgi:ribosomal protein S18 acetylase RimI-like enzyme
MMHAATTPDRPPSGIGIRDAGAADLPALIEIASAAYRADPLISYFVRNDARRSEALRQLFDFCLREQALAHGHVTMTEDGKACAAWLPPEARPTMPLAQQLTLLPRMARICSLGRVARLAAVLSLLERHHPSEPPHHYLYLLAVVPERQGQGLGSALLQAGLRTIDRARAATYLETATERNLALYERHGFAVTGETRLPSDGPKLWFLWRAPQTEMIP